MGKETMDFYRLYTVPGMFHGSQGAGSGMLDGLTPLVDWVEKGIAPEEITRSRVLDGKVVKMKAVVERRT